MERARSRPRRRRRPPTRAQRKPWLRTRARRKQWLRKPPHACNSFRSRCGIVVSRNRGAADDFGSLVVATLTALRRARAGRVALELDGQPWRTVPDDVVVRCGLHAGLTLDRPRLRLLRTELKRAEALATAGRALAQAPLSRRRLGERLRRRGVTPEAERAAVGTLAAAGLVDDARLAHGRAQTLADRGWGDLAIAARLEREGFGAEDART